MSLNFRFEVTLTLVLLWTTSTIIVGCNPLVAKNSLEDEVDSRPALETERVTHEQVTQLHHDEKGQCIFVKSEEGVYSYVAPGGTTAVCGLYVISEPDHVVEIEFENYFVRSCELGSLVSVINGWELNGQFFPGIMDHHLPKEARYHQFCAEKPRTLYTMDQNVGLVEFKLPVRGEGFKLRVRFKRNPRPCNVVFQQAQGVYTLRNFGDRKNCTASIIFPESFKILSASVGTGNSRTAAERNLVETGLIRQCRGEGASDFVEIRGGDGLDPANMGLAGDFCGVDSMPSNHKVDVYCQNTAVRLVSSGLYENSVTFAFDMLIEFKSPALTCPSLLESF